MVPSAVLHSTAGARENMMRGTGKRKKREAEVLLKKAGIMHLLYQTRIQNVISLIILYFETSGPTEKQKNFAFGLKH